MLRLMINGVMQASPLAQLVVPCGSSHITAPHMVQRAMPTPFDEGKGRECFFFFLEGRSPLCWQASRVCLCLAPLPLVRGLAQMNVHPFWKHGLSATRPLVRTSGRCGIPREITQLQHIGVELPVPFPSTPRGCKGLRGSRHDVHWLSRGFGLGVAPGESFHVACLEPP